MKFLTSLARIIILLTVLGGSLFASISNQTARVGPFITGALPATLSVGFPYQNTSDLTVIDLGQGGTTRDPGDVLTLNSDYTVSGGGYNSTTQMQTGNVVVSGTGAHTVLAGDYIVIIRNTPVTQTTTFSSTGILTGPMIEKALDKGITVSQQLTEESSRALRFEPGETLDGTLVRSARAGKLLGFDSTGAIAYSTGGSSGGGTTYTAGAGLQLNSNAFSVLPTQSFTDLTVTNAIVGSVTGNAATATALRVPRTINGVSFDGTADVTVPAAAGSLTGTALAPTVTAAPGLLSTAGGTLGTMAFQPASAVNITGGTITGATVTGLPAPVSASDAVRLTDLNAISGGLTVRSPVVAATTANITLSGPQTIDGQAVIAGNRVLVKNQTLTQNNGIYDVAAGAWSRSSDSNTAGKLLVGYYYFVSAGTTQGSTGWSISTAPTLLNTDPVVFTQFSANTSYSAGTGIGLAGNVFSINSNQTLGTVTTTSGALNGSIGAGTPNTGSFTVLNSTSGGVNGTIGATTPAAGTFTTTSASGMILGSANGEAFAIAPVTVTSGGYQRFQNSGGAAYLGLDSSTGSNFGFGNYSFNVYSPTDIVLSRAGSEKARITSTGMTVTSTLTATTGTFTNVSGGVTSTGSTTSRTLASRFANVKNVKDFGAVGDGVTNDLAAINAAVAALTNYSALYFPPGNYLCSTAGINAISSITNVTIYGEGAKITNSSGINNNTLVINPTCSNVEIRNLTFSHTAASRGTGVAIRLYSSYSSISNCVIDGAGEFGVLISNESGGVNVTSSIDNCTIMNTRGDGLHVGQASDLRITNLTIQNTGDDAIGIIDDLNQNQTARILVANVNIYNAGSLGSSGCGVRINEASDVLVSNVQVFTSKEAAIYVSRFTSTSDINSRITVQDCLLSNTTSLVGPRGAVWIEFADQVTLNNVSVASNQNGYGFAFLDCNDLNVKNCSTTGSPSRGFGTDDSTTTNVRSTWSRWTFTNNLVSTNAANEAYYFTPASGKTIASLMLIGNSATNVATGNYIFTNRLSTAGKVGNNTTLETHAIANGGSGVSPTLFNNN